MNHTARDIMTRKVIVVEEDTAIHDLIRIFVENMISCVPVMNNEKKLVGIVTKTDILGHCMDIDLHVSVKEVLKDVLEFCSEHGDEEPPAAHEMTVRAIMTPEPITAGEDISVESLAKTMIDHKIHRLIITRDHEITGIVSTLDILYHVAGINKK
ncbi:CBS domain-containing protein [bacterium]|nr:CBS domain-containing protein [bacterium]